MLLVIEKQKKSGVRDLNSVECVLLSLLDEFRSLHPRTSSRFGSLANPLPPFRALPCRGASMTFRSSPAVDLHGLCSIDLAQWTSGYRSVFKFEARSALSSGFSGTSSQVDLGRCQREERLETLGGSCQKPDQQSQKSLSRRELGIGARQLRFTLWIHRPSTSPCRFFHGPNFVQQKAVSNFTRSWI